MDAPADKRMKLRFAGTCRVCRATLAARTEAVYEPDTKTVRCIDHEPAEEADEAKSAEIAVQQDLVEKVEGRVEVTGEDKDVSNEGARQLGFSDGAAGASARREFERRQTKREERIRSKHPKVGGLILAISDDPQSTRAWDTGATGEERLGSRLTELASERLRVLHDRRIPRSTANIDHIAITPSGIWVIDAKRYKGRPSLLIEGGILRPRTEKLMVGKRDRSALVDGVLKQAEVVRAVVPEGTPIHGALCFVEADWPLIGGAFKIRGVLATWPKKLYGELAAAGPLNDEQITALHRRLAEALPAS